MPFLTVVITLITEKRIEPRLGAYQGAQPTETGGAITAAEARGLLFAGIGLAAVLAAYRIADSPISMITPLNPYFALVVGFAQKDDKNSGVGTLVSLTLPYVFASLALAKTHQQGWFGKVIKLEGNGTSNAGVFGGKQDKPAGEATNVVTDYVFIKGESRSPDATCASSITAAFQKAFSDAAAEVKDIGGKTMEIKFDGHAAYPPFNVPLDAPIIEHAKRAAESIGLTPNTLFSNGGLDANWFVKQRVPTVTIGVGQYEIHAINEFEIQSHTHTTPLSGPKGRPLPKAR